MSEEDFALKASTEAPWWSKAPIYLSLGIIGVPSLLAIGAGYFLANNVTTRLRTIDESNHAQIVQLNKINTDVERRWETVTNVMRLILEVQVKTCIHDAKNQQEVKECLTMADHLKVLERMKKEKPNHSEP